MPVGKLKRGAAWEFMCLGFRSASCGHVRVGGRLFALQSVCVGALLEMLDGLWLLYLPRFAMCDSISDSSVFGPTKSHNRYKVVLHLLQSASLKTKSHFIFSAFSIAGFKIAKREVCQESFSKKRLQGLQYRQLLS